uniref:Gametogenetin-binding protein 1 n=1 Tax=Rhinolophus ferrumequinum TaxID=59479 RepID=A0A671FNM2_RHIFE
MESPAPTPRYRILGRSSMFRFFRSLVGSKGSPKSSDKALLGDRACPSQEQDAIPLMMDHQEGVERKEPRPSATGPNTLSVALPPNDPSGLGMGDMGAQIPTPMEVLKVVAQGVEMKSFGPRSSQEVSEKEGEEEQKEAAGKASGDTGSSDRDHFAQALELEKGCLQSSMGPLEVSREAFNWEEEYCQCHCPITGDLRLASSKVGATPWNRLLTLYKQLQKSTMTKVCGAKTQCDLAHPQFPLKEALLHEEESEEEEMEEEDSSFKLCVPGIATLQSPIHKTFRSTDTVGFMESELKKLLVVQRESRLWKMGIHEDRELLTQPEITLEEAGILDGQVCLRTLPEDICKMGLEASHLRRP